MSVVICTYNRAAMLEDSLRSWREQARPGAPVELVVVDNKSTDTTREVVCRQQRAGQDIRYHYEEQAGLSFARNAGIALARAELIAFVDDDVYFHEEWLRGLLKAFDEHPDADCVGGRTLPSFERQAPDWMVEEAMTFYGATDAGDEAGRMTYPSHPFGVNMAFRRRVFEKIGTFNTSLGRKGTSLLSNEEKDLFYRMDAAGMRVFYAPEAIIHHRIPAERLDKQWLRERAYWQGVSDVAFAQVVEPATVSALARQLLQTLPRLLRTVGRSTFASELKRQRFLGEIRQYLVEITGSLGFRKRHRESAL